MKANIHSYLRRSTYCGRRYTESLITVIDGDPVNVALSWYRESAEGSKIAVKAIPVVNIADDRTGREYMSTLESRLYSCVAKF